MQVAAQTSRFLWYRCTYVKPRGVSAVEPGHEFPAMSRVVRSIFDRIALIGVAR
jgi:hypothetical protein